MLFVSHNGDIIQTCKIFEKQLISTAKSQLWKESQMYSLDFCPSICFDEVFVKLLLFCRHSLHTQFETFSNY